jgi:trans-aconitate methyltransferase
MMPGMSSPASPASFAQKWDASLYGARAAFVHRMASDLVDLLAPRAGERILDLGCGTGELTAQIAESGASVVGIDASRDMIEGARRRFPALDLAVRDGQALAYIEEFDAVFSNAAIHWMRRSDAVVQGVARALRPGGRFVAEMGGHGCIRTVYRAVEAALARRGEAPAAWLPWTFSSVAEYVALLDAAGLEVRLAHLFDRPTPVEGEDGLEAWLRTFLGPLEARLGDGWSPMVREVEAACAPTLRRDGGWVLDYVRLRVVALRP